MSILKKIISYFSCYSPFEDAKGMPFRSSVSPNLDVMIYKFTVLLILLGVIPFLGFSQDGTLDTTYGDNGIVVTNFNAESDLGYAVVEQDDGKLVVVGASAHPVSEIEPLVIRFLSNGDIDTTFGVDGMVFTDYGDGYNRYSGVALQNDGKIIASGIVGISPNRNFIVVRYLASGDLDTTFATNGVLSINYQDWVVNEMLILDDDAILLVGLTNSDTSITFARYHPDGTLDLSFGDNGYAISNNPDGFFYLREVKVLDNNELMVLGSRDLEDFTQTILLKFLATGYLDTNFGNNGFAIQNFEMVSDDDYMSAGFDITADGKIVIGGSIGACEAGSNPTFQAFLSRFSNNGIQDTTFGNNGTVWLSAVNYTIKKIFHQENGRLLVQGVFPDCFEGSVYKLHRYFSDGFLDTSFDDSNILEFYDLDTIIQEDGKILGVGATWWYTGFEDIFLVRYNNNVLDVNEFSFEGFKVHPNPSEGIFNLMYTLTEVDTIPFQVSDISGKIIQHGTLEGQQTLIDISTAQSGMYFLKASNFITRLIKN
ncbi:putative delta-60 repeat protein/predicted secreted protein (Por secretion system target) [Ulvibacter sp. MAR_2010_11]|uniref:T9SS type A sorting domain-containing protein n=1 Tax=Ulvibacter sp. MAR_2010_11 TaxID=1250229 RepID=UPI000C2C214C|nr:T9SS type A sorting domain-containing protein [Ulvibacter sp. MAR_2010_11]PKA82990.1 putative delta-60 repeat protein/predicted secreted protein (Por secretion system target) [Ulvibacter sp. MAR_2010_11]